MVEEPGGSLAGAGGRVTLETVGEVGKGRRAVGKERPVLHFRPGGRG